VVDILRLIADRQSGRRHSRQDLVAFARAVAQRRVPSHQISAWLMAAYFMPLDEDETAWLTLGMAESGKKLNRSRLPKPWVDKHSTGGVGDKTTLVLMPILAACGLTMVKMSGRGLGITGGTVDKLASIPGFRVAPRLSELIPMALRCGIAFSAQSGVLAPADRVLYKLRDVTGTVESIPLIVSSILSKKLAVGAEIVVLDVKHGSGAFMKTMDEAVRLAESLLSVGQRLGLTVSVHLSDMNAPLGRAVGNALEVKEAVDTLRGAPGVLTEHCVRLAGETLAASGLCQSPNEGVDRAQSALRSGRALTIAMAWFRAQGATAPLVEGDLSALPTSSNVATVESPPGAGRVAALDAGEIGRLVADMGGGRHDVDDTIDPAVGVWIHRHIGDPAAGVLMDLHLKQGEPREAEFRMRALAAYRFSSG
jgi:pyrimidine-nucleoside phosphorylase